MDGRRVAVMVVLVAWIGMGAAAGKTYRLEANGDQLEFTEAPERGYVVKFAEPTGDIAALGGIAALDSEDATPVRGLGRRGVWIVEKEASSDRGRERIQALGTDRQVAYAALLFSSSGETVAVLPEMVVRVNPGAEMEEVQRLCEAAGCTIRKRMEFTTQEYLLEVLGPDADAVFAAVEMLKHCPQIEWACPNTAFRPELYGQPSSAVTAPEEEMQIASAAADLTAQSVFPNDEYFPNQWHLYNTGQSGGTPGADIRAPEAWEITTGDPNIVVAVIDLGVDSAHPDLINNLVQGYDFLDGDDKPAPALNYPGNTHGTACAGVIAAQGNNTIGVSGVTWNCKVMPIRCGSATTDGTQNWVTDAGIAEAVRWAADRRADILSNSWGFRASLPATHSAIIDVTRRDGIGRGGKGCLVFSCAHNDDEPVSRYPQKYAEVTVVGATDHNDVRCYYSNYGPELDICAPSAPGCTEDDWLRTKGIGWIWTTDIRGAGGWNMSPFDPNILDYTAMGGTSMSCPITAGVAALILSIEPDLTGDEVCHFLERSAKDLGDPGRDDYYGWGRVDARAALDMVLARRADLNGNWRVDEADEAILLAAIDTNDVSADIAPAAKRDGTVDGNDLALLTQYMGTEIPDLGLIAHWTFDETEGVVAYDMVGQRTATTVGAPLWQPEGGAIGGALELSGGGNFLMTKSVRDPSEGPLSVFVWVKGGAPGQAIVSQQGGAGWLLADPAAGGLMTELKASRRNASDLVSEAMITDGDWHRVGFTWDGEIRVLYVDDAEVTTDTQPSLAGSTGNLLFGAAARPGPGTYWTGLIDDVRIYNRAVRP